MFFTRRRGGTITVRIPDEIREVLGILVADLRALLLADDDERLRRLYPTAHPGDERLEAEYRELMHGELVESRLAALDLVEASLDAARVTDEQLTAWMQATNSLRLVLGTQLDVSEDEAPVPPDHPEAAAYELYDLLNILLSEMVDVLSSTLPPSAD